MASVRLNITNIIAKYPSRNEELGNDLSKIDWDIEHDVMIDSENENWTVTVKDIKLNNEVTSGQNEVVVNKVDKTKFTIKGTLDQVECRVEITAPAINGNTATTLTRLVKVELIPTTLKANYTLVNVSDGESLTPGKKIKFDITTNADDYITYSSDSDVIQPVEEDGVINKTLFEAVNKGRCILTVEARKRGSVLLVKSFTLEVARVKSNIDGTYTTQLQLFNSASSRSLIIQHNTKELTNDVVLTLPSSSGKLQSVKDDSVAVNSIDTPFIVEPSTMTKNYLGKFTDSKYFTSSTEEVESKYYESEWQVAFDSEFTKIQYTRTIERTFQDFGTITVEPISLLFAGIGVWYIRVRHNTKNKFNVKSSSDWSKPIVVQFGTDYDLDYGLPKEPIWHYDDSNDKVVTPEISGMKNYWYLSYYGTIPINETNCVDDYNYRGRWQTIIDNYKPENYGDANTTLNRYLPITFKKGYQVIHPKTIRVDGKTQQVDTLWYALRDVNCKDYKTDTSVIPGGLGSEENWKEDDRDLLPTPKNLLIRIGLEPCKKYDVNVLMYQHGKYNDYVDQTDYIKYIYNGKLCFTTFKPTINGIAYGQMAMRFVTAGERTLRFGKKLYRVRLMTSEEYLALFGTLASRRIPNVYFNPVTELELDKISICNHEYNQSRVDFTYGNKIYYNRYNTLTNQVECINNGETTSINGVATPNVVATAQSLNANTIYNARLVLEYVPEELAVYNNIDIMFPNLIRSKSKQITYDKYSDTGFLGVVEASDFFNADEMMTGIGFTSTKREVTKWYMFYWNSMILYFPNSNLNDNIPYSKFRPYYPTKADNGIAATINKNNQEYACISITCFKSTLTDIIATTTPSAYIANYYNPEYIDCNITQGSMLCDLIYRIIDDTYVGYSNPTKYTNPGSFVGTQTGDNFKHPDLEGIETNFVTLGYGSLTNGRYVEFDDYRKGIECLDSYIFNGGNGSYGNSWNGFFWIMNTWTNDGGLSCRTMMYAPNPYIKLNNLPLELLYKNTDYPIMRFDILNPEKRQLMFRRSKSGTNYYEARIPVTSLEWYKIYRKIKENFALFGFTTKDQVGYEYQTAAAGNKTGQFKADSTWIAANLDYYEVCNESTKNYNGDKYVRNTLEWVRNANVKVDVYFRQTAAEYDLYTKSQANKATLTENTMSLVRTPTEIVYFMMKDLLPYGVWSNITNDEWSTKFANEEFKNEFITKYEIQPDEINYKEDKYNINYLRYRYTLETNDFDEWVELASRYLIDACYSYQKIITKDKGTTTTTTVRVVNGEDVESNVKTDLVQPNTTYFKHIINLWFNRFLIVDDN